MLFKKLFEISSPAGAQGSFIKQSIEEMITALVPKTSKSVSVLPGMIVVVLTLTSVSVSLSLLSEGDTVPMITLPVVLL